MRACKHEGCGKAVVARGMCNTHYKRWYMNLGKPPKPPEIIELVPAKLPGSVAEIARELGKSGPGVYAAIQKLKARGECHIEKWARSPRGAISPIYAAGPGKDAECRLKAFTPKQLRDRSKRNRVADGRWSERQAKDRMRWWTKKAETRKSTWLSALGVA